MKTLQELIFTEKPTPQCHASTVLPMPDGTVVAAWFGGTKEKAEDVDIWYSRRVNGEWSKPAFVSAGRTLPHWNPVLFLEKDGTVALYFKVGHKIRSWRTFVARSTDGGITFGAPEELVKGDVGGRGPVKNKIIRLSDGRLLAPMSTEKKGWHCYADTSLDEGRTWEKSRRIETEPAVPYLNADNGFSRNATPMIQPTLWESASGTVHMLTRTAKGKIYRSDSADYGRTWCRAYPTELPNNNSGIDLDKDENGDLWLVSNPVGENRGARTPLTLQHSADNGKTWETVLTFESEPGEYSYPAIKYYNGVLYITYTNKRRFISYWEVRP